MHALFSGQDCFLAQRKWQKLLGEADLDEERKSPPFIKERGRVMNRYFSLVARLPGILKHAYPLREARKHGIHVDPGPVLLLVDYTAKTRTEFLHWSEDLRSHFPFPVEIPSEDPTSPYPLVYQYENVWYGSVYMGYWASMLILQECLKQCDYPAEIDLAEDNKRLAENILRSLETVAKGVMGPFRIGYGMRIAYEFVDTPTRLWMKGLLQRYGRTYAGLDANSFPPIEGDRSSLPSGTAVEEPPPAAFR